jgi:two-component system response regulator MprA
MTDRHKVLIVDDDPSIREVLAIILGSHGYEVQTAADGRQALDLLHDGAVPQVILLDLMMPVMNGWTFREEMQRDAGLATIPVLVMTGDGEIADKTVRLSAAGFLRKPIALTDLLETVSRFC